jgi:DNA-binding transcriptional LysR family regulator
MPIELRDLRAFVAAAQERHFARAASRLYMSPSTMSEVIGKLERELGTPLFTRTTRRVDLTDAGAELLGRAAAILDLTQQAIEAVDQVARASNGVVRLGITPPAGPVIAPHLIHRFTAATPGLSVEVARMWLPALAKALKDGAVDAALTCGDLGVVDPDITTAEVGSEQLLIGGATITPSRPNRASSFTSSGTRHWGSRRPTCSRPGTPPSVESSPMLTWLRRSRRSRTPT